MEIIQAIKNKYNCYSIKKNNEYKKILKIVLEDNNIEHLLAYLNQRMKPNYYRVIHYNTLKLNALKILKTDRNMHIFKKICIDILNDKNIFNTNYANYIDDIKKYFEEYLKNLEKNSI